MKNNNSSLLSSSLKDLIEKFSQENIIAVMEKEYASSPTRLISTSLIDDTSYISSVPIKKNVIDFFAEGLKEKGFYNPLVIRSKGERYELILGRKRFIAAKKVGIVSLPCVIAEVSDEEELLMLLADNRDTRDCPAPQIALVYKALIDEFDYTHQTLSALSHISRPQVTNILRILKLPQEIQDEISLGNLSYGHGKVIASLNAEDMVPFAKRIKKEKLSVGKTEYLVREMLSNDSNKKSLLAPSMFGAKEIRDRSKSVTFRFESEEEKEAFVKKLLGNEND